MHSAACATREAEGKHRATISLLMKLPSLLNATTINAQGSTTTLLVSENLVRNACKWKHMKSVATAGFRQLVSKRKHLKVRNEHSFALLVSGNWFHQGITAENST
jgi:hypothetical protein